jgi:hypothetical protein
MKAVVVLLAFLAALKVGYQEYVYRMASSEIIVAAYRERAITACQREPRGQQIVQASVWAKPSHIRLLIGKSNLDVHFWQVDHALWNARYRNPYLFLSSGDRPNRVFCEFDIVNGSAQVFRM